MGVQVAAEALKLWRSKQPLTLRQIAINNNLKTYNTGKPCIHGHYSDRLVANQSCVECCQKRTRDWRSNNFLHIKEYSSAYHKSKPEVKRVSEAHRNAKKKLSEGIFTYQEIKELYTKQNGLCAICQCQLEETGYHIDHMTPLSRHGSNDISNIQLLCPHDNVSKNAFTDFEYRQKLGMLV